MVPHFVFKSAKGFVNFSGAFGIMSPKHCTKGDLDFWEFGNSFSKVFLTYGQSCSLDVSFMSLFQSSISLRSFLLSLDSQLFRSEMIKGAYYYF